MLKVNPRKVRGYLGFAGMSIEDLAKAVKVSRATIYNILNGGNTDLETVSAIAEAVNVHPVEILEIQVDPEQALP